MCLAMHPLQVSLAPLQVGMAIQPLPLSLAPFQLEDGALEVRTIRRKPGAERWDRELVERVVATPWRWKPAPGGA